MSHLVRIETQIRDEAAANIACQRLQLPAPTTGTFQLYAEAATGLGVQLREWRYPLVCNLETGAIAYDNFAGAWGDEGALDQFLQAYAIEKTRLEARRNGYVFTEQPLAAGAVKLTLHLGAA
ncbi:DUF1257 domain-containing protein [Lacipirellula sp.]|uniref:DUF1257 domain-containing protein n=1 Tax=Lacipirellula sp. TaxID=2691419 RepID=UPI003D0EF43C